MKFVKEVAASTMAASRRSMTSGQAGRARGSSAQHCSTRAAREGGAGPRAARGGRRRSSVMARTKGRTSV